MKAWVICCEYRLHVINNQFIFFGIISRPEAHFKFLTTRYNFSEWQIFESTVNTD